jgi:hypothetical protein
VPVLVVACTIIGAVVGVGVGDMVGLVVGRLLC